MSKREELNFKALCTVYNQILNHTPAKVETKKYFDSVRTAHFHRVGVNYGYGSNWEHVTFYEDLG